MANKRIVSVLILLSVMFLSLIGYLTCIELFQKEKLVSNPYNQRQWDDEHGTIRGTIFAADGVTLAKTEDGTRVYPYNGMYAHIIGYNSRTYGRINLESTYNNELLGKNRFNSIIGNVSGTNGYNLHLTIDHSIQKEAYNALGNRKGSVIAINPKTGAIIAMVSKPDFNPNDDELIKNWNVLVESEDAPFVARSTSGLYAPGSTFKLLTALSAIRNGYENDTYVDEGKVEIGNSVFENHNNRSYGEIDLTRGFAVSSNVVFCTLGSRLGGERLRNMAEKFGFNKDFDFDIPYNISKFPENVKDDEREAALGMGQGDIQSTPLQMALVTCGIANGGKIMKPYLVDFVADINGEIISQTKPSRLYNAADMLDTGKVADMMVETVKSGTGTNAAIRGIDVAGKTGTAENEMTVLKNDGEHTWFVGFAPAEDPKIAVVVMMEFSGGTGGGNCAPIARNIMQKYLTK